MLAEDAAVALVLDPPADLWTAVWELLRIGYPSSVAASLLAREGREGVQHHRGYERLERRRPPHDGGGLMGASYAETITVDLPYDDAVGRVKGAFKAQGFGTLSEIDVRATLAQKLGVEVGPYVILGACNPELAHRALGVEPEIGLVLPCNVVVRSDEGTVVQALDPRVIADVPGTPGLGPIAAEAGRRIDAALGALRTSAAGRPPTDRVDG